MIKVLFEAHLPVSNLSNSIKFYESLGLILENHVPNNVAFILKK